MEIIFTSHARLRMKRRHISEEEVKMAIKFPEKVGKDGEVYLAKKNIGRGNI